MIEGVRYWFWDQWFLFTGFVRSLWCFIVGHDVQYGSAMNYESDWCNRCYKMEDHKRCSHPDDLLTMPMLLNRAYVWFVDHTPDSWEKIDVWLWKRLKRPSWWEY